MACICSLFQVFPEITRGCFFITSHRKDLQLYPIAKFGKEKKSEDTKTLEQSRLEPDHSLKNLRSVLLGYLRVDECTWKEIDETISVTATCISIALANVRYAPRQSFRFTHFEKRDNSVVSELIFLG